MDHKKIKKIKKGNPKTVGEEVRKEGRKEKQRGVEDKGAEKKKELGEKGRERERK